jgi:hypothetical protein
MNSNSLGVRGTDLVISRIVGRIVVFGKINETFTLSRTVRLEIGSQRTNI